jgi:hypothetical protein
MRFLVSDHSASSAREEVEQVAQLRTVGSINFREFALLAGHGRESLVLDVEQLGEHPACGTKLIRLEVVVSALRAVPVVMLHGNAPVWR